MNQIKELAAWARFLIISNNISMSVQSKTGKLASESYSSESNSKPKQFQT